MSRPVVLEDLLSAMRAVEQAPYAPSPPWRFTTKSWDWWVSRWGEPTGFRYVRPDGRLVDPSSGLSEERKPQ